MAAYICRACGIQFSPSQDPPTACPICEDERQPVPRTGQAWTTLQELRLEHHNEFREQEPRLWGIGTAPDFAIGQRALLLRTEAGNVLWDCITLLDSETERRVRKLGGVDHIAISHPHYYSAMSEWADAFGATVHLAAADREWVQRPTPAVTYWENRLELLPGVTLVQAGGHFEGAALLHWERGAGGRGAVFSGDVIQVLPGRDPRVSFMRSYPMLLPLPASAVKRVIGSLAGLPYDRLYGAWWDRVIDADAETVVARSADLYLSWLEPRPAGYGEE